MPFDATDFLKHADVGVLRTARVNALLIGSNDVIDRALRAIQRDGQPCISWTPADGPRLPDVAAGTLVVRDVASLTADQQQQLLAWIDRRGPRAHVVATSGEPVWPSVERGAFVERLYYRLNVLYIDLRGSSSDA
jgi:lysophospholipase L1-like esterase